MRLIYVLDTIINHFCSVAFHIETSHLICNANIWHATLSWNGLKQHPWLLLCCIIETEQWQAMCLVYSLMQHSKEKNNRATKPNDTSTKMFSSLLLKLHLVITVTRRLPHIGAAKYLIEAVWVPRISSTNYLRVIRQDCFTIYDAMPSHFSQCTSSTIVISWFSRKTHY